MTMMLKLIALAILLTVVGYGVIYLWNPPLDFTGQGVLTGARP